MSKRTKTQILNYRVIAEKEQYENSTPAYVTYVPTLGISDYGPTLEKALDSTQKMIKFHIECLIDEGEPVPAPDNPNNIFVTISEVTISPKKRFAFA